MNFLKETICPICYSDQFSIFEKEVKCNNCKKNFILNSNQIIFEEVYTLSNYKQKTFSLNVKKKKNFTWRELNYIKTKNWLKKINSNATCLDLGCGPMTNKELFSNHNNTIFIDGAKFDNVNIVCNFEKKIPIKNTSIDCILLSNVLEHIFYPEHLLSEINRILKPGGKCLILVPFIIKLHLEPYDYHRYTKHALKRLLELANFKKFKIEEMGSHSNIIQNLLKLDRELNLQNSLLIKLIIKLIQNIIFGLFSIQKKLHGEIINEVTPQGYAIEIEK